ncbi:MAG: YigZ family protein [Intestinimonas sp.]|nr:YigZ family protein [Intestinimonas sp.]
MTKYLVPSGYAEAEFTEKRSRFIGHVWQVESEDEARMRIEEMKKRYYDSRHNCWCYRLRTGGAERYSDDGEPQGTAGQPMLNVFQHEGVENVCCVVTRYFGGVLLGTGGLVRAYTQGAKLALDAAGISVVSRWVRAEFSCPYSLFERAKQETAGVDGMVEQVDYAADVTLHVLLCEEKISDFTTRITEITAGSSTVCVTDEVFQAVPMKR